MTEDKITSTKVYLVYENFQTQLLSWTEDHIAAIKQINIKKEPQRLAEFATSHLNQGLTRAYQLGYLALLLKTTFGQSYHLFNPDWLIVTSKGDIKYLIPVMMRLKAPDDAQELRSLINLGSPSALLCYPSMQQQLGVMQSADQWIDNFRIDDCLTKIVMIQLFGIPPFPLESKPVPASARSPFEPSSAQIVQGSTDKHAYSLAYVEACMKESPAFKLLGELTPKLSKLNELLFKIAHGDPDKPFSDPLLNLMVFIGGQISPNKLINDSKYFLEVINSGESELEPDNSSIYKSKTIMMQQSEPESPLSKVYLPSNITLIRDRNRRVPLTQILYEDMTLMELEHVTLKPADGRHARQEMFGGRKAHTRTFLKAKYNFGNASWLEAELDSELSLFSCKLMHDQRNMSLKEVLHDEFIPNHRVHKFEAHVQRWKEFLGNFQKKSASYSPRRGDELGDSDSQRSIRLGGGPAKPATTDLFANLLSQQPVDLIDEYLSTPLLEEAFPKDEKSRLPLVDPSFCV